MLQVQAVKMGCLRRVYGVTLRDKVRSFEVRTGKPSEYELDLSFD